ncbi:hypothetical protein BB434_08180 [Helicobacter pylori]|nr:hypothetical protein BB434_08180 [Helicobacter pylori]
MRVAQAKNLKNFERCTCAYAHVHVHTTTPSHVGLWSLVKKLSFLIGVLGGVPLARIGDFSHRRSL